MLPKYAIYFCLQFSSNFTSDIFQPELHVPHNEACLLSCPPTLVPLWNANGGFCSTLDNKQVELQVSRGFVLSANKNIESEPGLSPVSY